MRKVAFLIDGFNVYHSILRIKKDTGYSTKWLNLQSLCKSYLHLFGKETALEDIFYFSAIPHHLKEIKPHKIHRHQQYIRCLESTGIQVILGRFKNKDVYCHRCKSMILKHEEKETDVSIAIKLLELFFTNSCDIAVIMSGDTDLSPAIQKCIELFPDKKIIFSFPFARKNKELLKLAPGSFSINKKQYIKHQLPNPFVLGDSTEIHKPTSW